MGLLDFVLECTNVIKHSYTSYVRPVSLFNAVTPGKTIFSLGEILICTCSASASVAMVLSGFAP